MSFVHLHVHTEYSLLDGAARINRLFKNVADKGMNAVAITDHGAMYGVVQFLQSAKGTGIKPIVGCEFYTCKDIMVKSMSQDGDENQNHLVLLAKDKQGYDNLVKLNTLAFVEGMYYKPKIDLEVLKEHTKGLICLSGCLAGAIPQKLLNNDYDGAVKYALHLKGMFDCGDFYIEIQDHGIYDQKRINPLLVKLAREIGVKLVATNDVHYLEQEDSEMQDVMLCIQTGKTLDEPNRLRFDGTQYYLKSPEEMAELFNWCPEAIATTQEIADKCQVISLDREQLMPVYEPSDGSDPDDYLRRITFEKAARRYKEINDEVKNRIEQELDVIIGLGFSEYYLIVWDFIDYAKNNDIPVGPGRGSGAGSIVAYILGITNVDPLRYDLLFERFLNNERVSSPDFDIDFCYEKRGKVIEYVIKKYGAEKVAQIITFGTLAAKAAIKDVGRVYGIPYAEVDKITKLMPFGKVSIAKAVGLDSSGALIPDLRRIYEEDPEAKRIIDMAIKIEGMPRNASIHAAGVVICRYPVGEKVPLCKNGNDITTQYDMNEIEKLGLLKMDFLGLRTLTDIKKAIDYIYQDKGIKINFDNMAYDDKAVYDMIGQGETDAVFQLESPGMKRLMMQLAPDNIEDLIAGIALFRPGPMDFIPTYVNSKKNLANVKYEHPSLEPILSMTYGCIVYQEQVMRIVRELGGYSLGGADILRRAMGKKDAKMMAQQEKIFLHGEKKDGVVTVSGALAKGIPLDTAKKLFEQMAKFAEYAFNKSHAAAYAYIAYETAYLKKYYPSHFFAAVINNRISKIDEITKYIIILKENKIKVYPPDINKSQVYFSVEGEGVRFGLMGIKNIGEAAITSIIKERETNGDFTDMMEFCNRVESHCLNKKVLESLIKGGAFDSFNRPRSQMMAMYEKAVEVIVSDKKHKEEGQFSLFDLEAPELKVELSYPNIKEYPENIKLTYEKEVLGMYISGHPLTDYMDEFKKLSFNTSMIGQSDDEGSESYGAQPAALKDGSIVTAGGVLNSLSKRMTKTGKMMAYGRLEDLFGSVEVLFFPTSFEKFKHFLQEDFIIKVVGTIKITPDEPPKIIANDVVVWSGLEDGGAEAMTAAAEEVPQKAPQKAGCLYVKIGDDIDADAAADAINDIYRGSHGNTSVRIQYKGKLYDTGLKIDYADKSRLWELSAVIGDEKNILYKEL